MAELCWSRTTPRLVTKATPFRVTQFPQREGPGHARLGHTDSCGNKQHRNAFPTDRSHHATAFAPPAKQQNQDPSRPCRRPMAKMGRRGASARPRRQNGRPPGPPLLRRTWRARPRQGPNLPDGPLLHVAAVVPPSPPTTAFPTSKITGPADSTHSR